MNRDRKDVMERGALTAKDMLEREGQCPPILVIFAKHKLYFLIMSFSNQEEKRLSSLAARYLIKIKKADMYQSILESWYVFAPSMEDAPNIRPSQSENRKEVVLITVSDRQEQHVVMLDVERTEAGATIDISDIHSKTKAQEITGGIFGDLFDERPLQSISIEDRRRVMAMAKQFMEQEQSL